MYKESELILVIDDFHLYSSLSLSLSQGQKGGCELCSISLCFVFFPLYVSHGS